MTEPRPALFKKRLGTGSEGNTIVWFHGWGQDHRSLEALASLFKKESTNLLYDLPGFGRSKMLEPGANTQAYADALLADLKGIKGKMVLAGHSFGCRVALRAARTAPERIAALVLIAAPGLPRRRSALWHCRRVFLKLLGRLAGACDRVLGTALKEAFRTRFGSRDYRKAGNLRGTLVAAVNEDLSGVARAVKAPTLLIYGERDEETPPEIGEKFQGLLGNGKLVVLRGIDHYNVLSRGIYQCEHIIRTFLGGLAANG